MKVIAHGESGAWVIVLHGGPAAAGEAGPIARRLSSSFRVLEPWQRGSGAEPLTVARHVADIHELIAGRCSGRRPANVGESWGAMLALAYAAEHAGETGPIVLIGCGTFDPAARAEMNRRFDARTGPALREELNRLETAFPQVSERVMRLNELTRHIYLYDPLPVEPRDPDVPAFDMRAHQESWDDMMRLQASGHYPGAFARISAPVLMIHGAHDPHPGGMIRDNLKVYLPHLEYREWARCGHSPWLERFVRDEFFEAMEKWLHDNQVV